MGRNAIRVCALTSTFLVAVASVAGAEMVLETKADDQIVLVATDPNATDLPTEVLAEAGVFFKINVPTGGTFVLTAPSESGIQVRADGELVLDLSAYDPPEGEIFAKALFALEAGDHAFEFIGADLTDELLQNVFFNKLGGLPQNLVTAGETIDATLAADIVAGRTGLVVAGTGTDASGRPGSKRTPFLIGGSGSKLSAAQGGGSGDSSTAQPGTAAPAPMQMAAAGSGAFPSGGGGGVTLNGGGSSGGGGGTTGGGGTPSMPTPGGTPTSPNQPTPNQPGTPTPGAPPVIEPGTAVSSPLAPPTDVTITQAVALTSAGTEEGIVANTGQTLFGQVMNPTMFDTVRVAVAPSGRTDTVDVGATTGQFALRLHPEDLAAGDVTVTLTGAFSGNEEVETQPVAYTFTPGELRDGTAQALSRLTFGATPELYARVQAIGFDNYLTEQLAPETIDDSAFLSSNPQSLLNRTTTSRSTMFRSIMAHNAAYAAFSEKQLQEVMGAFWWNHFHASNKDSGIYQQAILDREFFRENAFGRFEDLLLYSARSPLMSQFLDNDLSRAGNINENYGREILELHTVGVDGGYGDADVIAVSRVFTGWRYERTNPNAEGVPGTYVFEFEADRHDGDDKVIPFLGRTLAGRSGAAGVQEGEELITILSNDPRTHAYVCGKIVQKFVADQPPATFVDTCVQAWQASDGDSREILRAILTRPEFRQTAEYQRTKAKTPFEYAVSVIRAFGARPDAGDDGDFYNRFISATEEAGEAPLYFPVPTGLPEVGIAWTNSASMIARYSRITQVIEREDNYNIDMQAAITAAGLETAEEVAAYLLAVATTDRYQQEEFDAVVAMLKGEDGIFEPLTQDETPALMRALGVGIVLPSFQLQ